MAITAGITVANIVLGEDHKDLRWQTIMPGGFGWCIFKMPLKTIEKALTLINPVIHSHQLVQVGVGGQIVWRGVVDDVKPLQGEQDVEVSCVGRWGAAKEVPQRQAYQDAGYDPWEARVPTTTWAEVSTIHHKFKLDKYSRLYITLSAGTYNDPQGGAYCYTSDTLFQMKSFSCTVKWEKPNSDWICAINEIRSSDDAINTLWSASANSGGPTNLNLNITDGYDTLMMRYRYNGSGDTISAHEGTHYFKLTNPVVKYHTLADMKLSTIARNLVTLYGENKYTYDQSTISTTTEVASHLMFEEPISVPEMLLELNKQLDYNVGIWEDDKVYMLPKAATAEVIIPKQEEKKEQLEWAPTDLYNGVWVRYTDVNQRTAYVFVADTNPDAYLNTWGVLRYGSIWAETESESIAIETGEAFLQERNSLRPSGAILLPLDMYWHVKAGMRVTYLGLAPEYRDLYVAETVADLVTQEIQLNVTQAIPSNLRVALAVRKKGYAKWKTY